MPKKKKKKEVKVVMHQHIDQFGRVFGAPHPVDADHKNVKTKKFHDLTLERV